MPIDLVLALSRHSQDVAQDVRVAPAHRYVFGAGVDRPLVWYEGSGLSSRNSLHADELGSVIATSDGSTNPLYTYSPYGEPNAWNSTSVTFSRFRYTGQITLDASLRTATPVRLYHYKARVYDPSVGRFLQTDPVGYEDDLNLYAYVRNDPLNNADPTGRCANLCTGGIGAGVGAIINGGLYAWEANENGDFTWAGLAANAAEGAVTGFAIGSGAGLVTVLTTGAVSNVAEEAITDTAAGRSLGDNAGEVALNVAGDAAAGVGEAAFGRFVGGPGGRAIADTVGDAANAVRSPGVGYVRDQLLSPASRQIEAAAGAAAEATAGEVVTRAPEAMHEGLSQFRERDPR